MWDGHVANRYSGLRQAAPEDPRVRMASLEKAVSWISDYDAELCQARCLATVL